MVRFCWVKRGVGDFFCQVARIWGVILSIWSFLNLKATSCKYWMSIKIKISMTYDEVFIGLQHENWKLFCGGWTFSGWGDQKYGGVRSTGFGGLFLLREKANFWLVEWRGGAILLSPQCTGFSKYKELFDAQINIPYTLNIS